MALLKKWLFLPSKMNNSFNFYHWIAKTVLIFLKNDLKYDTVRFFFYFFLFSPYGNNPPISSTFSQYFNAISKFLMKISWKRKWIINSVRFYRISNAIWKCIYLCSCIKTRKVILNKDLPKINVLWQIVL